MFVPFIGLSIKGFNTQNSKYSILEDRKSLLFKERIIPPHRLSGSNNPPELSSPALPPFGSNTPPGKSKL